MWECLPQFCSLPSTFNNKEYDVLRKKGREQGDKYWKVYFVSIKHTYINQTFCFDGIVGGHGKIGRGYELRFHDLIGDFFFFSIRY